MKYAEMEGSAIRKFLGIRSCVDVFEDFDAFDEWNNRYFPPRDFYEADDRRREIIKLLIKYLFVGYVRDEEDEAEAARIARLIKDDADRECLAEELIDHNTCNELWDDIVESCDLSSFEETFSSIDNIVEASRREFIKYLKGSFLTTDDLREMFSEDEKIDEEE